ncbi:MAG: hypothetical protein ACREH9_03065 [Pseudomonadota bacterium]
MNFIRCRSCRMNLIDGQCGQINRKRKAEQDPDVRGDDRSEFAGVLALHRIAQSLGEGGNDREDGPKLAGEHQAAFSATTM